MSLGESEKAQIAPRSLVLGLLAAVIPAVLLLTIVPLTVTQLIPSDHDHLQIDIAIASSSFLFALAFIGFLIRMWQRRLLAPLRQINQLLLKKIGRAHV